MVLTFHILRSIDAAEESIPRGYLIPLKIRYLVNHWQCSGLNRSNDTGQQFNYFILSFHQNRWKNIIQSQSLVFFSLSVACITVPIVILPLQDSKVQKRDASVEVMLSVAYFHKFTTFSNNFFPLHSPSLAR